jgi:uncharacterized protein YndB with AHSA1/START domain
MSVTSVDKNLDNLTLTVIADFDASIDQVWELWSDPRKLESWWGPPGYPATFEKHDLAPGGEATYFMTGPEGDKHLGMWRVTAVDPPVSLQFTDAFADADGKPIAEEPSHEVTVRFSEREGGTRMEMRSRFESREDMERMLEMGVFEGMQEAIGQMDALLVGGTASGEARR